MPDGRYNYRNNIPFSWELVQQDPLCLHQDLLLLSVSPWTFSDMWTFLPGICSHHHWSHIPQSRLQEQCNRWICNQMSHLPVCLQYIDIGVRKDIVTIKKFALHPCRAGTMNQLNWNNGHKMMAHLSFICTMSQRIKITLTNY